jgi:hypothetical protein
MAGRLGPLRWDRAAVQGVRYPDRKGKVENGGNHANRKIGVETFIVRGHFAFTEDEQSR